jgi:hypothetical protein
VQVIPALHAPPRLAVERVGTVALVCILFEGGMHIGWSRFRSAAAPVTAVGLAGTVLTVAAIAALARGSGFLAVFTAGIAFGDEPAPVKREIERFHAALASLAEIVVRHEPSRTQRVAAAVAWAAPAAGGCRAEHRARPDDRPSASRPGPPGGPARRPGLHQARPGSIALGGDAAQRDRHLAAEEHEEPKVPKGNPAPGSGRSGQVQRGQQLAGVGGAAQPVAEPDVRDSDRTCDPVLRAAALKFRVEVADGE